MGTSDIGSSQHTYTEVLSKLFAKEQLPPSLTDKDFSKGLLCTSCTDLVGDLFRLQHELRGVKNEIVDTFKESQKVEKKTIRESIDSETKAAEKTSKKKTAKPVEEIPVEAEAVYIIETLKEKKGNKFLVKWETFGDEENTWEPKSSIPEYIL